MPLEKPPECYRCGCRDSLMWQKTEKGEVWCGVANCGTETAKSESVASGDNDSANGVKEDSSRSSSVKEESTRHAPRRGARHHVKGKNQSASQKSLAKGKSRRIVFKKSTTKAPPPVATTVTKDYVFYKNIYYQLGDIVSVMDVDGGIYYAQIRGLLQDQYCDKSAVLTWLVPTQSSPSPEDGFDPATYIRAYEEEIPRKLECMEFVMHAPSEYFMDKTSPYPTKSQKQASSFIWTRLGPQIRPAKCDDKQ